MQTAATFPDGKGIAERTDRADAYLREQRQQDFVDNLCKKLLSYARLAEARSCRTGKTLALMRTRLQADRGYAFGSLIRGYRHQPAVSEQARRDETQDH